MKPFVIVGALFGFLAILSGALGMHVFKSTLAATGGFDNFNLAQRYLMYHALALLVVGSLNEQRPRPGFRIAAWLFIAGCVLFPGSLYVYSLTGAKSVTIAAPFGGTALMVGWLVLMATAWRGRRRD